MSFLRNKRLHIISFDIPCPPDYGGAIDVFYKIKALSEAGHKVHLHCFEYGRERRSELEKICHEVSYYRRGRGLNYIFSRKPYIVATRNNKALYRNLLNDSHPIIYEGLHTTIYAGRAEMEKRAQLIRMHNIESDYYRELSGSSGIIADKLYFRLESFKLHHYEKSLESNISLACISEKERDYFRNNYPDKFFSVKHVPPFHENSKILSQTGKGKYVLFHGNLSVIENENSALFILKNIFSDTRLPLIIAGKKPSKKLANAIKKLSHVRLVPDPCPDEMNDLLVNAQIHLLPSFNPSGMKLKLINALYKGRFCVTNELMVKQTGLEKLCHIANTTGEFKSVIAQLFEKDHTYKDIQLREEVLYEKFSNEKSAGMIMNMLAETGPGFSPDQQI